jgi:hypothetical protein
MPVSGKYSFLPYLFNDDIYIVSPNKGKTEAVVLRGIIFFVDYPGIMTLPTREKILLDKIMEAIQLRLVQVRVINIPELMSKVSPRAMIRFEHAKAIFFTGKLPYQMKDMKIERKYEVIASGNSDFVLADPLENIDSDKELKKKLWNSLKSMFSLP